MKWYKKQMNLLLKASELASTEPNKETVVKKTSGHSFAERKMRANIKNFRNPVAVSKLSRDKTDVH